MLTFIVWEILISFFVLVVANLEYFNEALEKREDESVHK